MKSTRHLFLLFIALTIALSSCKKDDESKKDDENSTTNPIVGTWAERPSDLQSDFQYIYVFNSNNQGTLTVKNWRTEEIVENETFTYTFNSKTTRITFSGVADLFDAYVKFIDKTSFQTYSDPAYTKDESMVFYKQ